MTGFAVTFSSIVATHVRIQHINYYSFIQKTISHFKLLQALGILVIIAALEQ